MGCRQSDTGSVISIGVFEAIDRTKTPTPADLICLKSYSNSFYNPDNDQLFINESDLQRIGYSFRMSSNNDLTPGTRRLFSQGIPGGSEQVAVIAGTESVEGGGYTLSVNFRNGSSDPIESTEESTFINVPNNGYLILSNGMIVTWTTKQKKN